MKIPNRLWILLLTLLTPSGPIFADEAALFPISIEGKWGYIDRAGQVVIKPQYVKARPFSEGLAVVTVAGTSEEDVYFERTYDGFIKRDGSFAIPAEPPKGVLEIEEYRTYSFGDFHEGMARIHINDGTGMDGFIDRTGKLVIRPQFSSASDFSEGLAFVNKSCPWVDGKLHLRSGFINKEGRFVIESNSFQDSFGFREGRACVSVVSDDPAHWEDALINRNGSFVIAPGTYSSLSNGPNGWIRAVRDGQVGLLDRDGKVIISFGKYNQILEPEEGTIFIAKSEKGTYLINSNDKQVTKVKAQRDVHRFESGFAMIEDAGQVGYIDENGEIRIPIQFDNGESFCLGLALVQKGSAIGYINTTGDFVWQTDRWNEPCRNSIAEPLSAFLPESTIKAMPLSYNMARVENAIVFVAGGTMDELRTWYEKRCAGVIELDESTNNECKEEEMKLSIYSNPGELFIEAILIDGNADEADNLVRYYSCSNLKSLRKKYPKETIGILIEK